ncbi:MAG TPA: thermonuclease family protein [bacterium]|nr:thermonuclease family protein [bacterium]
MEYDKYPVVHVIDGDTIVVIYGISREKVRLIGIDTPEIERPDHKGEYCAQEALGFTRSIAEGQIARIEFDTEKRDKYGRLLGYVYIMSDEKEIFLNEQLIKKGLARTMSIPPNTLHADRFSRLQKEAASAKIGIWGSSTCSAIVQN